MISAWQYEPLLCVLSLTSSSIKKLLCWDLVFTGSVDAVCLLWWHFRVLGAGAVTEYTPMALDILPSPCGRSLLFHFLPELTLGAVSSTQGRWYCRALPALCQTCLLSKDVTSGLLFPSFPRSHQQHFGEPLWQPPRGHVRGAPVWSGDDLSCLLHQHPAALHLRGLHHRWEQSISFPSTCEAPWGFHTWAMCAPTQWEAGEIQSLWEKNLAGQILIHAPDELQQRARSWLDIPCGIQAGLAAGDGGHQCPQLPLKQTQPDCALPWARQVPLGTSVTVRKAPLLLFYCVLSSLCEIHEMRFQGFASVYLPFASLWGDELLYLKIRTAGVDWK